MRVGILGGTFNPIHLGHLKMAERARRALRLDHVLFIPSRRPPHRPLAGLAPAKHRMEMVRLALRKFAPFFPSTIEMLRRGRSYSVDTLRELKKIYGTGTRFFFILGSDSLRELAGWKDTEKLAALCEFAVVERAGFPLPKWRFGMSVRWRCLAMRPVPISATQTRERARRGQSLRGWVPRAVAEYIRQMKLYQKK